MDLKLISPRANALESAGNMFLSFTAIFGEACLLICVSSFAASPFGWPAPPGWNEAALKIEAPLRRPLLAL